MVPFTLSSQSTNVLVGAPNAPRSKEILTGDVVAAQIEKPMHTTTSRKRRRVRFEEDPATRQVKQRVVQVQSKKDLSVEEKTELWVQQSDIRASFETMKASVEDCRGQHSTNFALYEETLAETYLACINHTKDTTDCLPAHLTSYHMVVLGTSRGIESYTMPALARDRGRRRLESIQSIVQLHKSIAKSLDPSELVGQVAGALSRPSRTFARALGVADAAAAFQAYAGLEEPQQEKRNVRK